MLTVVFVVSAISRTHIQLQFNRFKESGKNVNDFACPSRPNMSTTDGNIEAVKKMVLYKRRITIREAADDIGMSFGSGQANLTNVIGMKPVSAKINNN